MKKLVIAGGNLQTWCSRRPGRGLPWRRGKFQDQSQQSLLLMAETYKHGVVEVQAGPYGGGEENSGISHEKVCY